MIHEEPLCIICDGGDCTRQAVYACSIKDLGTHHVSYVRMYCPECTKELTDNIGGVIIRNGGGRKLHDYLEVEHIDKARQHT